jgi:hypothetical protein
MTSNKKNATESACISGIINILILVKIYKMCMHTAHAVKDSQDISLRHDTVRKPK